VITEEDGIAATCGAATPPAPPDRITAFGIAE
jgi:hypothetical protein